jgi:hypothetical protein
MATSGPCSDYSALRSALRATALTGMLQPVTNNNNKKLKSKEKSWKKIGCLKVMKLFKKK